MKHVCVFCGSSKGRNNIYVDGAKQLGIILAEKKLELVGELKLEIRLKSGALLSFPLPQAFDQMIEVIERLACKLN